MNILYPLFLACLFTLFFTCLPVGEQCISQLGVPMSIFRVFCLTSLIGLVIHFMNPASQVFWWPVGCLSIFLVGRLAIREPMSAVQGLLVAVAVQFVIEFIFDGFPYFFWRGCPLYVVLAWLWLAVARGFLASLTSALTQFAALFLVAVLRASVHPLGAHARLQEPGWQPVLPDAILFTGAFWCATVLLLTGIAGTRLWHDLKVRKFRVI